MNRFTKVKSFFLAAWLACAPLFHASAYAGQEESDQAAEHFPAEESTFLDKSAYTDGSVFENRPSDVNIVKIGLRYGEDASYDALLTDVSGQGFRIGVYDDERQFTALTQVEAKSVAVTCAAPDSIWHVMLGGEFETPEKAESYAGAYGGYVDTVNGCYRAFYGSYGSRETAERAINRFSLPGVAYQEGGDRLRVLDAESGETLYTAREGASALALAPMSGAEGLTQFDGDWYRGGFECRLNGPGQITVINYVALEDYVKGVIPYEMNYNWPYEALRAQAVCARTYVVYNQNEYADQGFDITGDTYSQVYRGVLEANETTDSAVDSTAGQLIRYQGEICRIYYFAADGGASEDGLAMFDADLPYLAGKIDPFEQAVDFSLKSWTVWRSGEALAGRLQRLEYEIGTVTRLEPEYSDTGNVIALSLYDKADRCVRLTGRECYSALGLNSCRYTIEKEGEFFLFYGGGLGHNCGMSQWGANAMASVYGYNYEDIIRFYFTGAYIA